MLEHYHEHEQGRLAALRGESLATLPPVRPSETNFWLKGWRDGTRQRLCWEACLDATTQELVSILAVGWTQTEIARALRISSQTVSAYLATSRRSPRIVERIKTLCEEVQKAEEWLWDL